MQICISKLAQDEHGSRGAKCTHICEKQHSLTYSRNCVDCFPFARVVFLDCDDLVARGINDAVRKPEL